MRPRRCGSANPNPNPTPNPNPYLNPSPKPNPTLTLALALALTLTKARLRTGSRRREATLGRLDATLDHDGADAAELGKAGDFEMADAPEQKGGEGAGGAQGGEAADEDELAQAIHLSPIRARVRVG